MSFPVSIEFIFLYNTSFEVGSKKLLEEMKFRYLAQKLNFCCRCFQVALTGKLLWKVSFASPYQHSTFGLIRKHGIITSPYGWISLVAMLEVRMACF